jgi:hypothetical protein
MLHGFCNATGPFTSTVITEKSRHDDGDDDGDDDGGRYTVPFTSTVITFLMTVIVYQWVRQ